MMCEIRRKIAALLVSALAAAVAYGAGDADFNFALERSWREANLAPVRPASDAAFLRRARLKLTGKLPSPGEIRAFVRSRDPDKRAKLVDRLIASQEFADMMAMRYCQMFRVKSEFPINMWPNAVQLFHAYLRDAAARDLPYDRMARELLTTDGSNFRKPQVNFLRGHADRTPEGIARGVMLSLAGIRLEKLPEAYRKGAAAFFVRLKCKSTDEWKEEIVFTLPDAAETTALTPTARPTRSLRTGSRAGYSRGGSLLRRTRTSRGPSPTGCGTFSWGAASSNRRTTSPKSRPTAR